jgi:hypothetical protein
MDKFFKILFGINDTDTKTKDVDPDPNILSVDTAYKTRWIWYHTILAGLIAFSNILLIAILVVLTIKL